MIGYYMVVLCWIIYCSVEGMVHEFIWNKARKANNFNNYWYEFDIHKYFTVMRMALCIPFIYMADHLSILLVMMFVQPFIHNGFLYMTRHNDFSLETFLLDGNGESSAEISFDSGLTRFTLFLIGIGIIFVQNIWYINH